MTTDNTAVIDERGGHHAAAIRHNASFLSRLTTGTGAFDILGRRRYYYIFSSVLIVASILFMIFRGFHLGIDFAGGTRLTFQPAVAADTATVGKVFSDSTGGIEGTVQTIGQQNTIQISSAILSPDQASAAKKALTSTFKVTGGVSDAAVSGTWGAEISQRALLAVVIFLVLVGLFIWIRYEKRVAVGAVVSVLHDLVITGGIYAGVGFEVTPATVIGLLTILGFSLYDTVVVYDKVQENSKGLLSLTRRTYPEAANLAVNQTLMRSINTSLIALLPVAGLLVAGVAILGSGTLKDLSLVLLVGMLLGAYSSVFVAVPVAVDLKLREGAIKAHTAKVLAKRRNEGLEVDADGDPVGHKGVRISATGPRAQVPGARAATVAPRPGAKPVRPGETGGEGPENAAGQGNAGDQVPRSAGQGGRDERTAGAAPMVVSTNPLVSTPELGRPTVIKTGPIIADSAPSDAPVVAARKPAPGSRPLGKAARPTGKRGR